MKTKPPVNRKKLNLAIIGTTLVLLCCCGGIAAFGGDDEEAKKPAPAVTSVAPTRAVVDGRLSPTPSPSRKPTPAKTSTRPTPKPTTKRPTTRAPEPEPEYTQRGVHPGAYCSNSGAFGLTDDGTLMRCRTSATDSRLRWRRA